MVTNRHPSVLRPILLPVLFGVVLLLAGCGAASSGSSGGTMPGGSGRSGSTARTGAATPEPTGFVFDAADVVAYYQSIGYACVAPRPSTVAAGYTVATCQVADTARRTRVVGLVTAGGKLGNAYAAVFGAPGESYLEPDIAVEPLAAFLGAMLGQARGGEAAVWLREHLGAPYEKTMSGSLTLATYTGAGDDPSKLYVELADGAYLKAPTPAPSK
jgi:hypothetical protein